MPSVALLDSVDILALWEQKSGTNRSDDAVVCGSSAHASRSAALIVRCEGGHPQNPVVSELEQPTDGNL